MSFRPYREEMAKRLLELAELMGACRQAFRDTAANTQWRPAPGSAGAADVRAIAEHDPPYPSDVHARLSFLLYFYMSAASEHLGGLAVLYATKEVMFPPGPLIRAIIEHCARIFWVLQRSDSVLEDKLARLYLEELFSAEQAKRTSGRLQGKDSDPYRARATAFKALRQQAEGVFGGSILDGHGRATIRGQQLIGLEECVAWMYEFVTHPLPDGQRYGVYDYTSNISHPTLYTHFDMWGLGEIDGRQALVSQMTLGDHEKRVGMAVVPFYEALGYLSDYYGWPSEAMERLTVQVEALLPELFAPDTPRDTGQS